MIKTTFALLSVATALSAQAAVNVTAPGFTYSQNFDSLARTGAAETWSNNGTLAGWSLFVQPSPGTPLSGNYSVDDGTSNAGAFKSLGSEGSSERALGGVGSGGSYFGSTPSGAVAGWIAVAFQNGTSGAIDDFTVHFDGEQWRNGGNTSAQSMVLEFGFGSVFSTVALWTAPGAGFDWSSPVTGASALALDGNAPANRVAGVGGTITSPWAAGDTLWLRWAERNDFGNDHALAIDNLTFSVTAVPEPQAYALLLAGLVMVAGVTRRRVIARAATPEVMN